MKESLGTLDLHFCDNDWAIKRPFVETVLSFWIFHVAEIWSCMQSMNLSVHATVKAQRLHKVLLPLQAGYLNAFRSRKATDLTIL